MIEKTKIIFSSFLLAFIIVLGFSSCQDENWMSPIPYVIVDTTINLNNQQFLPLRLDGGYVEILGGYKGILIYRHSETDYRAFEKASPYRTNEVCAYVYMDPSGLFLREGCDNSVYDFNGQASGGISQFPLQRYQTHLEGNYLKIYNQQP